MLFCVLGGVDVAPQKAAHPRPYRRTLHFSSENRRECCLFQALVSKSQDPSVDHVAYVASYYPTTPRGRLAFVHAPTLSAT